MLVQLQRPALSDGRSPYRANGTLLRSTPMARRPGGEHDEKEMKSHGRKNGLGTLRERGRNGALLEEKLARGKHSTEGILVVLELHQSATSLLQEAPELLPSPTMRATKDQLSRTERKDLKTWNAAASGELEV